MKRKLLCQLVLCLVILASASHSAGASSILATDETDATWSIFNIDEVDPDFYVHYSYTSLAIDSQDRAHVSYRGPAHDLRYATNQNNCWSTGVVYDASVAVARENSLALDSSNQPHFSISYDDGHAEDLLYARKISGQWRGATVDSAGSVGMENDIAIDRNGNAHISHWAYTGHDLKYSTNSSGAWASSVITDADWSKTAIAVGSDGFSRIVFIQANLTRYAINQNGRWQIETVDPVGPLVYPGRFAPNIALDSNNAAHISYSTFDGLKFAHNRSGIWQTTTITPIVGSTQPFQAVTSIVVDRNNHIHISFYEPARGGLKYANNVSGTWRIRSVDNGKEVGRSNSIAVDSNNYVHISYRDDSTTPPKLKYATNATNPILTPCPAGTDTIFTDDFESGDLSRWSQSVTDNGDLSVASAAALQGSYGLQARINNNTVMYVADESPNAEPRYRARFYFDPNSIAMAHNDWHQIFFGYGNSIRVLRVGFRFANNQYYVRAELLNDSATWTRTQWYAISDQPHAVELDWRAASGMGANNGGLTLWIDGVQKQTLANIDNDTRRIDHVRLGPVAGIDQDTRGSYFLDAFESRRQSYIGPLAGILAATVEEQLGSEDSETPVSLALDIDNLDIELAAAVGSVGASSPMTLTLDEQVQAPVGYRLVGSAFVMHLADATPYTLTIDYRDMNNDGGLPPSELSLWHWNEAMASWEAIPASNNPEGHLFTLTTQQPGIYALMQQERAPIHHTFLPLVQQ